MPRQSPLPTLRSFANFAVRAFGLFTLDHEPVANAVHLRPILYNRKFSTPQDTKHASLVQALHPHSARSSRRRGGRKPQISDPRRLHPPARRGHLLLSFPRAAVASNKIMSIVREEMDTIGQEFFLPALHPARIVGGERPLGRHGRQHVPPEGPQGRRPLPRHDARRGHDRRSRARNCAATSSFPRSGTRSRPSFATSRAPSPACCACASSS